MDFVDEIDLVAPLGGRVLHVLQELPGVIDSRPGGRVHLDQVDEAPLINSNACRTDATGLSYDTVDAIERLGQDPGQRSLPHPAGTREEIRMVEAFCGQRVHQRLDDMTLANQLLEASGPPFACENGIAHG